LRRFSGRDFLVGAATGSLLMILTFIGAYGCAVVDRGSGVESWVVVAGKQAGIIIPR
jgi:hypothetical protein